MFVDVYPRNCNYVRPPKWSTPFAPVLTRLLSYTNAHDGIFLNHLM